MDAIIFNNIQTASDQIEIARKKIEAENKKFNLNNRSQAYSILLGSLADIYSDWIFNKRSLDNLNTVNVKNDILINYGYIFFYGIGFGAYPFTILRDEEIKCGFKTLPDVLDAYGLAYGIESGIESDSDLAMLSSKISELAIISRLEYSCILFRADEFIEAQELEFAIDRLIASLNARVALEAIP